MAWADRALVAGEDDIDTARLFDQIVVDEARLRSAVQCALRRQPQVTLRELLDAEPLNQGLAERVAYLELAHAGDGSDALDALDGLRTLVDEAVTEPIRWQGSNPAGEAVTREGRLPRVIFTRRRRGRQARTVGGQGEKYMNDALRVRGPAPAAARHASAAVLPSEPDAGAAAQAHGRVRRRRW